MIQTWLLAISCALPSADYQVVLKSGKALEGEIRGREDGIFQFVSKSGEEMPLARFHIRCVEGKGPFADPKILWREIPEEKSEMPADFVRTSSGEQGSSLDVGVAVYEQRETKRRIYLVGAVHVAHAEFYHAVQSVLDSMDLVLWEGVGAKEKPSKEALERFDVLFRSQILLRNLLNLEGQLEQMNYNRGFWRNSDMSINELQRRFQEKGLEMIPNEKLFRLLFGTIFAIVDPNDVPRVEAIARPYRALVAPLMSKMADPGKMLGELGASGMKEIILDARNRVVMDDLAKVLQSSGPSRIAIFYGAAHLPGMDKVLREELHLKFAGMHWIPAWRY